VEFGASVLLVFVFVFPNAVPLQTYMYLHVEVTMLLDWYMITWVTREWSVHTPLIRILIVTRSCHYFLLH